MVSRLCYDETRVIDFFYRHNFQDLLRKYQPFHRCHFLSHFLIFQSQSLIKDQVFLLRLIFNHRLKVSLQVLAKRKWMISLLKLLQCCFNQHLRKMDMKSMIWWILKTFMPKFQFIEVFHEKFWNDIHTWSTLRIFL